MRVLVHGCTAALVAVMTVSAGAQQTAQSGGGQGSAATSTSTPTPAPTAAQSARRAPVLPQGFSVVLVLGDLTSSGATDDVPQAARKALTDMRDFLPFKSYKLLDAAWLMCCADSRRPASSERRSGSNSSANGSVTQTLRGPDEQEYQLRLSTSIDDGSRVFVRFALSTVRDVASTGTAEKPNPQSRELASLVEREASLAKQASARRDAGQTAEAERLDKELRQVRSRISDIHHAAASSSNERQDNDYSRWSGSRTIMDTSFTMDVGETVVVGTSRLKGANKALIALLTAVPPRGASTTAR